MATSRIHKTVTWNRLLPLSTYCHRGHAVAFTISSLFFLLPISTNTFNIDVSSAQIYQGPSASFFGFSLTFHRNKQGDWLLAGAPKADSVHQQTINGSGAVYKCPLHSQLPCTQIKLDDKGNGDVTVFEKVGSSIYRIRYREKKDDQWLGVSLASHNHGNGSVVACAHRWTDTRYGGHYFGNGACYQIDGDFNFNTTRKLVALTKTGWQVIRQRGRALYFYGYGQMGMATHFTTHGQTLVIGAPGVRDWTGAIVEYAGGQNYISVPDMTVSKYGLLGYAVTSGRFYFDGLMYYVTGAPRLDLYGKVFIYRGRLDIRAQLIGEQLGSYFGAALCVLDLNGDGYDDLLVGAPLYKSQVYEEGRVYVFIVTSMNVFERLEKPLTGSGAPGGRFGTAIASAGDLNLDGYPDFLVGAPYEEGGRGAIYVYNGNQGGVQHLPTQRLAASVVNSNLRGFGHAIANSMTRDGEAYPDVGVGAYVSDMAVVMTARPVVYFNLHAETHPTKVNPNKINCRPNFNGELRTCLAVGVTFSYSGARLPGNISFRVKLSADVVRQDDPLQPLPVRGAFRNGTVKTMGNSSALLKVVETTIVDWPAEQQWLDNYIMILNRDVRDLITPLSILVEFDMIPTSLNDTSGPVLNIYKSRFMTLAVPFVKSCGDDEICLTDLRVDASVDWPDSKHYVILGHQHPISVQIDLHNSGEKAYMTSVTIGYPPELQYVRVMKPSSGHMTCNLGNEDVDAENTKRRELGCEFRDPIPDNSTKRFVVIFDPRLNFPLVRNSGAQLIVNVTARTRSNDTNVDNNVHVIRLPVRVEANLSLTGVSQPEQHVYDASQFNGTLQTANNTVDAVAMKDGNHDGTPEISHYYDIVNNGPGLLPSGEIFVRVPVATFGGTVLLNASIQGRSDNRFDPVGVTCFPATRTSRKVRDAKRGKDGADLAPQEPSSLFGLPETGPLYLDCLRVQCEVYRCEHGPMGVGDGVLLVIKQHLHMANLVTLTESGSLMLVTRLTVVMSQDSADELFPETELQVVTPINPLVHKMADGEVPLWVTITAIVVGNLLLGVVSFVLYKMGFFKRAQREELDQLIGQNEENEENEIMMRNEVEQWERFDPYDPWQPQTPETNLLMNNPLWPRQGYNLNNNGHILGHHTNGRLPPGHTIPIPSRQVAPSGRSNPPPPPVPNSSYRNHRERALNNNNVSPHSFEAGEGPT